MKSTLKAFRTDLLTIHPLAAEILAEEPISALRYDPQWHEAISSDALAILLLSFPFHVVRRSNDDFLWLNPSQSQRLLLSHPAIHLQKILLIEHEEKQVNALMPVLLQAQPALERRSSDGFYVRSNATYQALRRTSIKPMKKKDIAMVAGCCPSNLRKGE